MDYVQGNIWFKRDGWVRFPINQIEKILKLLKKYVLKQMFEEDKGL